MNEEELLKALERQIRSPEQATPPERALRPMRPLTDDERYERETKRILKAEERMDATDKVLSRLERMEHRIRRIDNQLKEINRHTKATFNLVALIVAGVAFTGVAYALNKVLGTDYDVASTETFDRLEFEKQRAKTLMEEHPTTRSRATPELDDL